MQRYLVITISFTTLLFVLMHIGFHQKYIALFPAFDGLGFVTHFHATLMFLWMALLVAQPVLIVRGKTTAHKIIGKLTYLIAPLLILSMFLVTNQGFGTKLKRMSLVDAYASLSVNLPDFFAFGILYLLGIYFRKKTAWHARFMIATSFPIIGAGIVRILIRYMDMSSATAFTIIPWASNLLCLIFLLTDIRTKNYIPYLITLIILVIEYFIWLMRYSSGWQDFAKWYVATFIN